MSVSVSQAVNFCPLRRSASTRGSGLCSVWHLLQLDVCVWQPGATRWVLRWRPWVWCQS